MSDKKGGLGKHTLQYTRATPKFLQKLKAQHLPNEVDINDKFKEYMSKDGSGGDGNDNIDDDDEQQEDEIEKEARLRALDAYNVSVEARKARLYEKDDLEKKALEEERQRRIEQDQLEEERAKATGEVRKIKFQKPLKKLDASDSAGSSSSTINTSSTRQPGSAAGSNTSTDLKQTLQQIKKTKQSPKAQMQSKSKTKTVDANTSTRMLSFDEDEM
ncbi:hypothetical protein SAMD00019534_105820, partial [Acytostelium subglobosum LB1]|uniref:hypothetical protein n=1 Tax=Acytostelium subglobosum LB1 TaxID=1410327 RepID=UPI000644B2D7